MPLPTLNTGGTDITNTLMKIRAMQNQDLQDNYLKSRIAANEALAGTRAEQNALRQFQLNKEKLAYHNSMVEDVSKSLAWVSEHPEPDKAYTTLRDTRIKEGIDPNLLPEADLFYTKGKDGKTRWDDKAFKDYSNNSMLAMKMVMNPVEGKTFDLTQINPAHDPKAPDSSKYIKRHMAIQGGQPVELGQSIVESPLLKESKAPTTRKLQKGSQIVTQEWDSENKEWKNIATGPAWKPDSDGEGGNRKDRTYHRQLEKDAFQETKDEINREFKNTQITVRSDGTWDISNPSDPRAVDAFLKKYDKKKREKVNAAVDRKDLPEKYRIAGGTESSKTTTTQKPLPTF